MVSHHYARLRRTIVYVLAATILPVIATAGAAGVAMAQAPTPNDVSQGKLLVIELFFLLVGLAILAALGYLIWQSWRRKKEKEKKAKR